MSSLIDAVAITGTGMGLLLTVLVVMALIQMALRYTKPNIGYHVRSHRDREYTFFVRNLDSVHYQQPFHVIVSGLGLKYVAAQAGPWSLRKPVRLGDDLDGRIRVLVVLDEMPEDAAFAIRALCTGDAPTLEIADDSPLQTRAFRRPLARFTRAARFRYYGVRYVLGVIGFSTVFLGGLWLDEQRIYPADGVLVGLASIAAWIFFALVVPYDGKSTIVGYLTSTEADRHWGERVKFRSTDGVPKLE